MAPARGDGAHAVVVEATAVDAAYMKEEVAKHSTKEDCWLIINEEVYDVTEFMDIHPGDFVPEAL